MLMTARMLLMLLASPIGPDDQIWNAICQVESGRNPKAWNRSEDAVGISQIRRCVVKDCNRIVRRQRWTYQDRWSPTKSREMFDCYLAYYGKGRGYEFLARTWNGGPRGMYKTATESYWRKVIRALP